MRRVTFATSPSFVRAWRALRFAGLALVTLFVSHDLVFVLQYGPGPRMDAAMSAGGHDGWWTPAMVLVGGVAVLLAAGAAHRLSRLRAIRRGLVSAGRRPVAPIPYRPELLGLWRALAIWTTLALLAQENVEHLATTGHLAGLEPLAGPLTAPAIALVALVFAAVGALVRWRIAVLESQIAAMRVAWPRIRATKAPSGSQHLAALLAHRWLLVRQSPGRAPPAYLPG